MAETNEPRHITLNSKVPHIPGIDFLREVKVELEKVIWPSRQETIRLTLIVILVTIIVGFFVAGVDYILSFLLKMITGG